MKNFFRPNWKLLSIILLLFVSFSAFSQNQMKNTISVNGSGTVKVEPDTAKVSFSVVTINKIAKDASAENAKIIDKVQKALISTGIKEEDFSTTNYSLNEDWNRKENEPISYRVNNTLQVTVKNIDTVGAVIDAALNAGANKCSNISFSKSDTSDAVKLARSNAVKQAYETALQIAEAAGRKLGKAIIIDCTDRNNEVSIMRKAAFATAAVEDNSIETQINPGLTSVTSNVSIVYELK